jgi:hypothetical protein
MQIGPLILRARLVFATNKCRFPPDRAKLGAPLPVPPVEQENPFPLFESEHISEVVRLFLGQRDFSAWCKRGRDEEALELGRHGHIGVTAED